MDETTKRANFIRLAQRRTTNAIKAIRRLSNLANRSNYAFSQEDADKIVRAIMSEADAVRQRMASTKPAEVDFKL